MSFGTDIDPLWPVSRDVNIRMYELFSIVYDLFEIVRCFFLSLQKNYVNKS